MGGLKTGPPRRHRIQSVEGLVLDPRTKETYLKRGRKVDPVEIKSGAPGGSSFGPFIAANLLKRLFQVEADLTSNSCESKLELGRPIFARLLFLRFEDQKRVPSLSYCFASISIGLRPSRPASKPASKLVLRCFVLISMVSRH